MQRRGRQTVIACRVQSPGTSIAPGGAAGSCRLIPTGQVCSSIAKRADRGAGHSPTVPSSLSRHPRPTCSLRNSKAGASIPAASRSSTGRWMKSRASPSARTTTSGLSHTSRLMNAPLRWLPRTPCTSYRSSPHCLECSSTLHRSATDLSGSMSRVPGSTPGGSQWLRSADPPRVWQHDFFTWDGKPVPQSDPACPGRPSPDGRLMVQGEAGGSHSVRFVAQPDGEIHIEDRGYHVLGVPWTSITIIEGETCAPLVRVQSVGGISGNIRWPRNWLPTSDGYLVSVLDGYALLRILPTPALISIPASRPGGPASGEPRGVWARGCPDRRWSVHRVRPERVRRGKNAAGPVPGRSRGGRRGGVTRTASAGRESSGSIRGSNGRHFCFHPRSSTRRSTTR